MLGGMCSYVCIIVYTYAYVCVCPCICHVHYYVWMAVSMYDVCIVHGCVYDVRICIRVCLHVYMFGTCYVCMYVCMTGYMYVCMY